MLIDEPKRIFVTYTKLKEYYCNIVTTNSSVKVTYPDMALLLILSRILYTLFKFLTSAFILQPTISIEETINILVEYEIESKSVEIKTKIVVISKSSSPAPRYHYHYFNFDSEKSS
jgi:hypothetical protein